MSLHPTFSKIDESYQMLRLVLGGLGVALLALCALAMLLNGGGNGALDNVLWVMGALALAVPAALLVAHRMVRLQVAEAGAAVGASLASAHSDALTGVFTRSYFLEAIRRDLYHGSGKSLGYMQIDMDNLKVLNDGNGHGAGDQALVHLAKTMRALLPDAIIGRLGGDEFGIAIPGMDNKRALRRLGDELRERLGRPVQIAGRTLRLSATIGVATAPQDASDVDDLISKADLALYTGKRAGRSATISFDEDMLGDERHRRFVERELRAAILMNELELYYQPIYSADGKTLRSFESLVRWQHKVRGTISPGQFVPVAEMSDLIDKLGEWVLRRCCADMTTLLALGGTAVAINISPVQLRRPDFAARFAAIVAEVGGDLSRLLVEITETVPLLDGGHEPDNLSALRSMGVRVAIDDFGAGHASLHYLRGFAFDVIKIDRTYVADIAANRIDAMIVRATCDIARSLPVEVIAEGVETQEQMAILQAAGCTGLQGFLLGRPQPLRVLIAAAGQQAASAA